jgi:uncharacterized protein (TIGR04222 family)
MIETDTLLREPRRTVIAPHIAIFSFDSQKVIDMPWKVPDYSNHSLVRALLVIAGAIALTLSLVSCTAQEAEKKVASWIQWDVDISIHNDGSFDVVETHELRFSGGEFTFGFRNIPLNQAEQITSIGVRKGDTVYAETTTEEPYTFYTETKHDDLIIHWFFPPTRDTSRIFTVSYTVEGGVLIYDGGDQLYWKAVGSDRGINVWDSTVTVRLPEGAEIELVETYGVSAHSPAIAEDGSSVTFTTSTIPTGEEFEVRVQWSHGYVNAPVPSWQAKWERQRAIRAMTEDPKQANLLVGLLSAGLIAGGIFAASRLIRYPCPNFRVGPVPATLNEPPGDLEPGIVGALLDGRIDMQEVVATLIDLARRGLIEVEETTKGKFTFRQRESAGQSLKPYEQAVMDAIFATESEVSLAALKYKFYKLADPIYDQLGQEVVNAGLLRSKPNQGCGVFILLFIALFVAGIVSPFMLESLGIAWTALTSVMPVLTGILLSFASLIVMFGLRPRITRKGAEQRAKWLAFKKDLEQIQQFVDLEEAADLFEKYLPYAIAFGIKRGWIEKFARIPQTAQPRWYITPSRQQAGGSAPGMADGLFAGLSGISDGLFTMLNATASTFSSRPTSSASRSSGLSSSSGGFSGGGSSGGGGGGGGGGGFG